MRLYAERGYVPDGRGAERGSPPSGWPTGYGDDLVIHLAKRLR